MAGFTPSALEKKLLELNNSQQSIQTLSLWLIHHRKHHKAIVQVWIRELKKAKPNRKLTFMYLANDVIQNSKKKGPEFSREFSTVLGKAFAHVHNAVSDEKTKSGLDRIINVWEERNVYESVIIEELRDSVSEKKLLSKKPDPLREMKLDKLKDSRPEKRQKSLDNDFPSKKKKTISKDEPEVSIKSPPGEPPDTETLIKALQDLENSPSTDAEVREKIASLPPKVSDISLLEKLQNREAAETLLKQVDEACTLLADYNSRLSEELENRKQVSKMLSDFLHLQREQNSVAEKKVEVRIHLSEMQGCLCAKKTPDFDEDHLIRKIFVEEYREKLKRVSQVRNELKSHLQNLPDLTLLPSVTGGLAPLPSAGDLFNQP